MDYFRKMRGGSQSPPRVSATEIGWSWIGAMLGIAAVAAVHYHVLPGTELILIIGSFGATAVLVYGAVRSPLAQPRNLVGGHVISAAIGVAAYHYLGGEGWLPAAAAVATAIAAMHFTKTLHPPGGATALIAVIGGEPVHRLGFLYVIFPVACGALILLAVALVVNNIPKGRKYPEFWF